MNIYIQNLGLQGQKKWAYRQKKKRKKKKPTKHKYNKIGKT